VRYGYRKIRVLLNREGWDVGKYLVYRLYIEEGLSLQRMKPAGKRKITFEAAMLAIGTKASTLSDYFETCRRKRNVIDYMTSSVADDL
jgi:hypothetical protein